MQATLNSLIQEKEEEEEEEEEEEDQDKKYTKENEILNENQRVISPTDSFHENDSNSKDNNDYNEEIEQLSGDEESENEDIINIEVFHSESRSKADKSLKFSCSMCSFQSQRKSHFLKHTALHQTMTTIYRCEECSFSTLRFTHLRRHQVTHSIKPLACSSCSYSTDDSKLLARHTRLQHKVKQHFLFFYMLDITSHIFKHI